MMITRQEAIERALVAGRGYTAEDERGFLYDLASIAPDGIAVEVGVLFGCAFISWTAAREGRGEVVAVDNWVNGVNASKNVEAGFRKNLAHYEITARIITGESWECADQVGDKISFAFIDADHMAGVAKDIAAYCPRIVPGGIVAFHDYYISKPVLVRKSVAEWLENARWELVGKIHSTVAYRNPL